MNKLKNIIKKNKEGLGILLILIVYCAVSFVLHIPCPIEIVSGCSCMGCGMTRAALSLAKLDFAAAFYYHPLIFAIPPMLLTLFLLKRKNKQKAYKIVLGCFAAAFIIVYVLRIIFGDGNVVRVEPANSIFYKAFLKIKDIFDH